MDLRKVVLRLDNVTKTFGGLTAVSHVSFEVKEGEIFGIIGPNGAGKTTLFNLITAVVLLPFTGILVNIAHPFSRKCTPLTVICTPRRRKCTPYR